MSRNISSSNIQNMNPWNRNVYITPRKLILFCVILLLLLIIVFLTGVYLGKREGFRLAQQNISTEVSSDNPENRKEGTPSEEGEKTRDAKAQPKENQTKEGIVETGKTETNAETAGSSETAPSVTPIETASVGTPQEGSPEKKPESTSANSSVGNEPTPQPPVVLTPYTPPIENEIQQYSEPKNIPHPQSVPSQANTKQNTGTYSIQLTALTGNDAEKRARAIVNKLQKKYGNQYQFKIYPTGKFYKIAVVNIPDEMTAKSVLKILSQEPDFQKAFIIKPKK